MRRRFIDSLLHVWVKVITAVRRIDTKLTGAKHKSSLFGVMLLLAVAFLLMPILPLCYIAAVADEKKQKAKNSITGRYA